MKRAFPEHTSIPRIARFKNDHSYPYFEEIDQILERRIEEAKEELQHSESFQPEIKGHWIFVHP